MGLCEKEFAVSTNETLPTLEALATIEELFQCMDKLFSESGQRRRFIESASQLGASDLYLLQAVLAGTLKADEALAGAKAAENPLRIANALLELETTVQKSKDRVLLDFIFALLDSGKVTKGLNRAWFFPWELALVLNKQLSAEQVRFIWQSKKEMYAKELVPSSMRVLVKHPQCPPDVLTELLPYDDGILRKAIAQHKNISPEIASFFLNSARKPERLNLALSRHASSETLLSLMADKYDEIVRAAKNNLAKRFPTVDISAAAISAAVGNNISKPYVKPTARKEEFNPRLAAREDLASIETRDSGQRTRIAASTNEPHVLRALAEDNSKAVRRAVAKNLYTEHEVLCTLARDADTETSNNALTTLTRTNPDLCVEDLLTPEAINTAYREIAHHINANSGNDSYADRFTTQQALNFNQARLVAQLTHNPLIQLMIIKDLDAIPEMSTARWDLLSALSNNCNLVDSVARKFVMQLDFAPRTVIRQCKNVELLNEFLQPGNIPIHDRSTVEDRLRWLQNTQA